MGEESAEEKTTERLLDLAKTMIPVLTGFLALVVATFEKSIERGLSPQVPYWTSKVGELSAVCGIMALASWCVSAAISIVGPSRWTDRAVLFGRIGLVVFIGAALTYGVFVGKLIMVADR
jgi:hypothetical protein